MIVDPDRGICENIPYLLDWSQYGVSGILTANSYEEAISRAVDFQPHIALVELELSKPKADQLYALLAAAEEQVSRRLTQSPRRGAQVLQALKACRDGAVYNPGTGLVLGLLQTQLFS